ncbi:MAG: sulfatase-like hydrolase/transferase [Chitinophagaceae bacterium]|nr:sulfatase-like hydrolase/transferase [Chitinophagaceae bacterium]
MNYKIENYSIFDIKDYPALSQSNALFPIHATLLTNKIFHKRLLKNISWWFVTGKLQVPFIKRYVLYKDDDYNKQVEEKVLQSVTSKIAQSQFFYAHFFLPHGQYFRDSTGAFNRPEQISDLYNKSLYLSYLKYTNTIINGLVKNINAMDPGAIVVIMSDHGFYDYQNKGGYEPYNFDNICFLRLPGAKPDSSNLPRSNVNFFRYLFNTGYGQNLPYVKDSTVFVIEEPAVLR